MTQHKLTNLIEVKEFAEKFSDSFSLEGGLKDDFWIYFNTKSKMNNTLKVLKDLGITNIRAFKSPVDAPKQLNYTIVFGIERSSFSIFKREYNDEYQKLANHLKKFPAVAKDTLNINILDIRIFRNPKEAFRVITDTNVTIDDLQKLFRNKSFEIVHMNKDNIAINDYRIIIKS